MLTENVKKILERNKYRIVGQHSAVQVCRWTKKSLRGKGSCWKEKFYGIKSSQCCQMSPAVMWCENQCLHCWRPIEFNLGTKIKDPDEPKEIIGRIIKERKNLLMGCKGNKDVDLEKFKESLEPNLFTFSLSGEPTLYPKIGEMIKEVRRRDAISFLVTNGLNTKKIKELERKGCLPTQLTISMNSPNKELYEKLCGSSIKNAWEKFNKTLKLMSNLKCRTVIRLTLIKGINMKSGHIKQYGNLIRKANPMFIHVKGYVALGYSKKRLGDKKMPYHKEIQDFAKKLLKFLKDYKFLDEKIESRVVLLGKDKRKIKINDGEV